MEQEDAYIAYEDRTPKDLCQDINIKADLLVETAFIGNIVTCKLGLSHPCCGEHETLLLCPHNSGQQQHSHQEISSTLLTLHA